MKFFAQCFIDPVKIDNIQLLREKHLDYVKRFLSVITYGGVCGNEELPYQSICFFLDTDTEQDALKFVEQDPYSATYSAVEIKQFTQKVPNLPRS